MFLYCTADKIGGWSGGSKVTHHESNALSNLGKCHCWDRDTLLNQQSSLDWINQNDPWHWDIMAKEALAGLDQIQLAHFYSGTFSHTIIKLQEAGTLVTYTIAAHSIEVSKQEHEKLGFPFPYPHLTDPNLWMRYIAGCKAANVIICPSTVAAASLQSQGFTNRIQVIPHGCDLPEKLTPSPNRFIVGYLGSCGAPDKGVVYLLRAWKRLNYPDALLILAGQDSTSPWVKHLVKDYGGGNIRLAGWMENVNDFYNRISLLVQPSMTEGFGLEVLEAMAYGRPVLCSTGAGAADAVPESSRFQAGNIEELAEKIKIKRQEPTTRPEYWQNLAKPYEWAKIRKQYTDLWSCLLRNNL